MALGKPNVAPQVAACYDCHGYHDVLPPSDPRSHLSKTNILATCQQCHPGATARFTEYEPHANPLDGKNYPLLHAVFLGMTGLLIGTFAFFGLHTLGWLVRAIYLYLHDSKKFREAKIQTQVDGEWFTRFSPFERFLHFLVVTSFLLLVITGMPLKFYYTGLGQDDLQRHWRPGNRAHVASPRRASSPSSTSACTLRRWRARPGKAGNHCATRPAADSNSTGFGRRCSVRIPWCPRCRTGAISWRTTNGSSAKARNPQFDRWTYWEKFDYFAVFWGVAIIGASGLIMWFPTFFTRFLPGWIINIALILHSDEALLAAGFIFSIHFFNTHFRIEKFPMDTVIFSGRVSKTEMLHERKRWYDRLVAEGKLDEHRVKDEWERWKNIARSFGYFFFGLGIILLILIIYAMATRLAH